MKLSAVEANSSAERIACTHGRWVTRTPGLRSGLKMISTTISAAQ
jgi:hypothetical protein